MFKSCQWQLQIKFKFMKKLRIDNYTQGILATTKLQSRNARIKMIPPFFQETQFSNSQT